MSLWFSCGKMSKTPLISRSLQVCQLSNKQDSFHFPLNNLWYTWRSGNRSKSRPKPSDQHCLWGTEMLGQISWEAWHGAGRPPWTVAACSRSWVFQQDEWLPRQPSGHGCLFTAPLAVIGIGKGSREPFTLGPTATSLCTSSPDQSNSVWHEKLLSNTSKNDWSRQVSLFFLLAFSSIQNHCCQHQVRKTL